MLEVVGGVRTQRSVTRSWLSSRQISADRALVQSSKGPGAFLSAFCEVSVGFVDGPSR